MPNHPYAPVRSRARRGFTLLLALGLIAMITVTVMVALRAVTTESNLQAHERRAREAFFAAEAGMAEGRVIVQAIVGDNQQYNGVFEELGNRKDGTGLSGYVTEAGLPSTAAKPWYQVMPWRDYQMTRGTGVDTGVSGANLEINGPDGVRINDYPEPLNVHYRVFVVDDADADPSRTVDTNNQIWIVSVGEVTTPGGQPYRTIVRSLVTNENGVGGGGGYGTKLGGGSNGSAYGGTMPTWTP
ncbi:hypothetical protein JY651_33885 [Pyxidicoccus parkwayensis]|uniref:Type 4 fimbrial biogenesis protein PilX N-terminal domain-containing protein n=1 Tax=Pyxidicoccus parkwayensis TaxID=2813578 RepID=A0ABX7PD13_9BACT|nr:hypothetical protein JY651_33885 [Pyxidicoccus parkwaysis]